MERTSYCFLCKTLLSNNYADRTEVAGRVVCCGCGDLVNNSKPNLSLPQTSIKEKFYREISMCATHNKKFKLTCITCNSLICVKCAVFHSFHKIEALNNTLTKIYCDLVNLELGILYSKQLCESEELDQISSEFFEFYASLEDKPTKEIVVESQLRIEEIYGKLQKVNQELNNIPLLKVGDLCKFGRKNLILLDNTDCLIHVEWGEKVVHLVDLKTLSKSTYPIPVHYSGLIYSKLVYLPFNQVFICGGRKSAAEVSLPDSFILSTQPKISLTAIQPMPNGRSNHFVLYLNDNIYVLGGLDSSNLYTKTCMRYSLRTDNWDYIAELSEQKDTIGGCCDSINEKIFIFGGKGKESFFAIEEYSVQENTWKVLNIVMPCDSCMSGSLYFPCKKELIIFGGQNAKSELLKNVWLINLENEIVNSKAELPIAGGPIVEPPVWRDGKVVALFFEGYVMRKLLAYNCSEDAWEIGNSINDE